MSNESKIAFITGANRGLGLETARGLGKLGITVLMGSRDGAKGEEAAAKLRKSGIATVESVAFDVANPTHYGPLAEMIEKRFGRLDILINNAGIVRDEADFNNPNGFNTVADVSQKALRETFDTNFFGVVALTQTLLPLLRKAPAARVVNVSSALGSLGMHSDPKSPYYGVKTFAYNATKTALNAFTVHLAALLRDTRIKVNSADPGWVKTDMGGPGAMLEVDEGAKTAIALATLPADGPTGSYIHLGQTLPW